MCTTCLVPAEVRREDQVPWLMIAVSHYRVLGKVGASAGAASDLTLSAGPLIENPSPAPQSGSQPSTTTVLEDPAPSSDVFGH